VQWLDRINHFHALFEGLHGVFLTVSIRISYLFASSVGFLSDHFALVSLGFRLRLVLTILTFNVDSSGLGHTGLANLHGSCVRLLILVLSRFCDKRLDSICALFCHHFSLSFAISRLGLSQAVFSAAFCTPLSVPGASGLGVTVALAPASTSPTFVTLHALTDACGTSLRPCTLVTSIGCRLLVFAGALWLFQWSLFFILVGQSPARSLSASQAGFVGFARHDILTIHLLSYLCNFEAGFKEDRVCATLPLLFTYDATVVNVQTLEESLHFFGLDLPICVLIECEVDL